MGYAVIALVLMCLALLVWLIIQAAGRRRERIDRIMQQAGFFPLSHADTALTESLRAFLKRTDDEVTLGRVYHLSGSWCDLYTFDPQPNQNARYSMIVRSNRLNLPGVVLHPKVTFPGKLGVLLNKLTDHVITRKMPKIDLGRHADLATHYSLYGDDATSALALITPELTRLLIESPQAYGVYAQGDMFAFSLQYRDLTSAQQRPPRFDAALIRTLADAGQRLFEQLALAETRTAHAVR